MYHGDEHAAEDNNAGVLVVQQVEKDNCCACVHGSSRATDRTEQMASNAHDNAGWDPEGKRRRER